MRWLFSPITITLFILSVLALVTSWIWLTYFSNQNDMVTDLYEVDSGLVKESINVTGKVDVAQVTRLSFPVSGVIQQIFKTEGDVVNEGELIASIATTSLVAEYDAAYNNAEYFRQIKEELIEGATIEERSSSQSAIELAEAERDSVINTYNQLIKNARQSLLSNDLQVYPVNPRNDDTPPLITGSYTCENEGQYLLSVYASNARSGYSYVLSGLESGTYSANVETPAKLGDCGLYIQFDGNEVYGNSDWQIDIPNTRSESYLALNNEYNKLQAEFASQLKVAEESVKLAKNQDMVVTANPTESRLRQAEANYNQALSELSRLDAVMGDRMIISPFTGIVSEVSMKPGEAASPAHQVTIISPGDYLLKALVPEIDIVGVEVGQTAGVYFDAAPDSVIDGQITFVSPASKNIGGVSYYDTHIVLDENPDWIREGLNADVEIILNEREEVVRVPLRYIYDDGLETWVTVSTPTSENRQRVELGLVGSDDMVEVLGVEVGTKLILP